MSGPAGRGAMPELTEDALFGGRLRLAQPRRGHRFAVDSVVLAACAAPLASGRNVLDACAGVGVLGLAVAWLCGPAGPPRSVTAVELQAGLARLARRNADGAGLRLDVVAGDMRRAPLKSRAFDLVVANPPFRRVGTGRLAGDPGRALARHEIALPVADLLAETARLLASGGVALVLHLPERTAEITDAARRCGLDVLSCRRLVPHVGQAPVAAILALGGAGAAAPGRQDDVLLHDRAGGWSPAVRALLERGDPSGLA